MNSSSGGNLQNVLSISTAANNRYLFHFNSLNSLTQWTAGIRLAMYEHATLQEAYTGSLVAGKGKLLNNIRVIMERSKFKSEDWARVRFGAGTPWRRCWCVISPPDEKEYQKMQKNLKKKNAYERKIQMPKGDIKFYDTRRINKKTKPVATISDAYAAYAIYPQSKPLIDQSTLIKLEGLITIHSSPETTTEGFIFVMPEAHAAVTGFEMMLRWLFPVFDTFALYGRPNRLIADTLDQRGLMFAMPRDRRYGYLDILDVSGLVHTEGSQAWSERQWRLELKKLTSHRMNSADSYSPSPSRLRAKTTSRTSLPSMEKNGVRFDEDSPPQSNPISRKASPAPKYDDSIPGQSRRSMDSSPSRHNGGHARSASEAIGYQRYRTETPTRMSYEAGPGEHGQPPPPPVHGGSLAQKQPVLQRAPSDPESPPVTQFEELNMVADHPPVTPVVSPPAFLHGPNARPANQPYQAPELRRATSEMDAATLHQMQDAIRQENEHDQGPNYYGNGNHQQVAIDANSHVKMPADVSASKGVVNQPRHNSPLPTIPASPLPPTASLQLPVANARGKSPPAPQQRPVSPPHSAPESSLAAVVDPSHTRQVTRQASSQSISRKPIPPRVRSPLSDSGSFPPSSPSSVGAIGEEIIDAEALEAILSGSPPRTSTMKSSIYDDDSVDYASTNPPSPKKEPMERPRAGRMKTVGDASVVQEGSNERSRSRFDNFHEQTEAEQNDKLPAVDFGPTLVYKPSHQARPSSSETPGTRSPTRASPGVAQRNSYFGGALNSGPVDMASSDEYQPGTEQRRSRLWQPNAIRSPEESQERSLTPEQWVQYRANMASQPLPQARASPGPGQRHSRQMSGSRQVSAESTPPISRTTSGDWTQMQRTPPQNINRPNSRNAGMHLNAQSPSGLVDNRHLSAREQMHVARATRSPLISMEGKDKRADSGSGTGLYSALEAREREKQATRAGGRSGMVQQAIAARQQQQAQAELQAQAQANYQMHQAAQAAQAAQYQAYLQQQAFAQSANFQQQQQYPQQQHQYQQQHQHQQQQQQQQQMPSQYGGFQQRPNYPQRQSSRNIDQYGPPQTPGATNWQPARKPVPPQQQPRASWYGEYTVNPHPQPRSQSQQRFH